MTMCRVFTTAGLVYIAGGLAYLLAGTSELQVRGVRGNNQRNKFHVQQSQAQIEIHLTFT